MADQHHSRSAQPDQEATFGVGPIGNRPHGFFSFWGHRWLYDLEELAFAAAAAGFPSHLVTQVGFRQGRLKEVADFGLDIRNDESLYVEITKPAT